MREQAASPVPGRSLRETMAEAELLLRENGIEDAPADAWYLLEYVTGMDRTRFLLERQQAMELPVQERYLELARRRAEHMPLQYLTGSQEFMGFAFKVNEDVLIPRQDTEILAEEAVNYIRGLPETGSEKIKVLDLCTGSGCIAVSLKKLCKAVSMTASDLSKEALCVAEENGRSLDADVTWIQSDLFEKIDGRYDLIVSNPPYIRTEMIDGLSEEVRFHEPRAALDGHEDGLYFYRRIAGAAAGFLKPGGRLMLEIGFDQGEAVRALLEENGFRKIKVLRDLAGLDRVVTCACREEKKRCLTNWKIC